MSYKTEIKVYGDPKFYLNGVTFSTAEEAELYGRYKRATWTMADAFRVVESTEVPNYTFADGRLTSLAVSNE